MPTLHDEVGKAEKGEPKPVSGVLCQKCQLRPGELVGWVILCAICRFQRYWREECCE